MFPVLYSFYGFDLYSYTVVIFFGVILASFYFVNISVKKKLMLEFLNDYLWLIILVSVFFARIGGILEFFSIYKEDPVRIIYLFDGKYNLYGGIFGFLFIFYVLTWIKKENFWKWLDALSLPFLVIFIFKAMGEFFAGTHYGMPVNLPWAVSYNIPEVRYTIPVHPVQIYEAILLFLLIIYLRLFKGRKKIMFVSAYAFSGFFLIQFCLSFLRGVPVKMIYGFKITFLLSGLASAVAMIILIIKTHPNINFFRHEN